HSQLFLFSNHLHPDDHKSSPVIASSSLSYQFDLMYLYETLF
ncbi:hypothetical protein NT04LM_4293, partial [Listeria monocytogenes FSL F2-208]